MGVSWIAQWSANVTSAVHANGLARHEVGFDQEQHRPRDRVFTTPPSERRGVFHGFHLFGARSGRRKDRSGGNSIHEDLIACQLERERLGERNRAGFRDVARKVAWITRTAARSNPV